jgi:alkanesulfonate monooxygenase SsuD/methylene tetrahydromethanopterin reductase-like flavin-dependent oxidoreductase (luciferase family)
MKNRGQTGIFLVEADSSPSRHHDDREEMHREKIGVGRGLWTPPGL